MESTLWNRRQLLRRCAGATAGGLALCLIGCTRDTKPVNCAGSGRDTGLRGSLAYREQATDVTLTCGDCAFFAPGGEDDACGQCELLQGPVNVRGTCSSWSAA